ncbi:MerR family transcriptional regulator [Bulleidia sp. zg-1006]|uniref:MerR family transcriptional regulator n=1 Tax=Bulleidia sp. zg-1006 TaxID=2806552 RepID=UPI00193A604B|nr:MerR family transcriptional regulator [Bulleidia sp. zg-1006]QRG86242.1 MerR family transcriptional regulator [Bulleidia sp. zg-1006]
MKVNEFAKRIGLPNSTIRFYDRIDITESTRVETNNYRNYNHLDALNIYSAQSLRGFHFSIDKTKQTLNSNLAECIENFNNEEKELELEILRSKQRLSRLQEIMRFVDQAEKTHNQCFEYDVDDYYMVESFGQAEEKKLSEREKKSIEELSDALPFSYVAIHIRKEDILNGKDRIPTQVGLGILENKRKLIGLDLDSSVQKFQGGKKLSVYAYVEDPFLLDRSLLLPVLEKLEKEGKELRDFYGRLYISYTENNIRFHGITVGCSID